MGAVCGCVRGGGVGPALRLPCPPPPPALAFASGTLGTMKARIRKCPLRVGGHERAGSRRRAVEGRTVGQYYCEVRPPSVTPECA
jgi:hypothetical protein